MDFYMHHGRTNPDGAAQQKVIYSDRVEYLDVDDWGFEGPRLKGVIGFHCTYGVQGNWNLWFEDSSSADEAARVTGWEFFDNNALTVKFSEDNSTVKITDPDSGAFEFFGDWGIK